MDVKHPVAVGEVVEYKQKVCPCTGKNWNISEGKIRSVSKINGVYVYDLFNGVKVAEGFVTRVMNY